MKSFESDSHSIGDSLLFEMQSELQNRKLLENDQTVKEYIDFISAEKAQTIPVNNLIKGDEYIPLGFQSAPIGKLILVKQLDDFAEFIDEKSGKLFFNHKGRILDFPLTKEVGDGFLDTIIFDDVSLQQQFLTKLKIQFVGWTIKIKSV